MRIFKKMRTVREKKFKMAYSSDSKNMAQSLYFANSGSEVFDEFAEN